MTNSAKENSIAAQTSRERSLRQRMAGLVDGTGPHQRVFVGKFMPKTLCYCFQHEYGLGSYFRAYTIALDYGDFLLHKCTVLFPGQRAFKT